MGSASPRNAWLPFGEPRSDARVRLFCLPYAGGGASVFRPWRGRSLPGIDLCPVQLPGREARIREAPFRQLDPLVEALIEALRPHLGRPYALFGHSMGALVSYELVARLTALGHPPPVHFFVSGARPPDRLAAGRLHTLPDAELAESLRALNGTPLEVLEHAELMELCLPVIRADFEICETWRHPERSPLPCPITAFGGIDDTEVSEEHLRGWARMTTAAFDSLLMPGDHFFLTSSSDEILRAVVARLAV